MGYGDREGCKEKSLKAGFAFPSHPGSVRGWLILLKKESPTSDSSQAAQLLCTHGALFEGSSKQQPGVASSGQQDYAVAPSSLLPHVNVCFAWAFNSSRQPLWELRFA